MLFLRMCLVCSNSWPLLQHFQTCYLIVKWTLRSQDKYEKDFNIVSRYLEKLQYYIILFYQVMMGVFFPPVIMFFMEIESVKRSGEKMNWFQKLATFYTSPISKFTYGTVSTLGPVVQSVVSLTSSFRVISLTVLADSIHNILIFFAEKM